MQRSILIIDDSPEDLDKYQRALEKIGDASYAVASARDGNAGLAQIESVKPDCVLLDYSLPGNDGVAILQRIRVRYPYMPVVVLTGQGNESIAVRVMKAGGQDYICKSDITPDSLHRIIGNAILQCQERQANKSGKPTASTVLVIDDNPDDRESFMRMLKKVEGITYRYAEAADGLKGVEMIRTLNPDCVLLDYSLPGYNGLEILKRLRASYAFVPVIMLTGQGNETIAVQAMKEGAQDYLVKAVMTPELLHRTITSAIEHVSMESALKEHQDEIQRQAEELKYINEELETFTYIASHDMRSPLVSLKGFSNELSRAVGVVLLHLERQLPNLPEADREMVREELSQHMPKALRYIVMATERMERLTGSILKLSRLGRGEILLEPIQTRSLVENCLTSMAHQIEKSGTKIEIETLPDIVADRAFVEQVFGNILDNALKYLDPSRPGAIHIKGEQNGNQAAFSVTDNGRGIAKDDMHKVFEIFRRAGNVESIPGEGMGMPYVRTIVRRHQGNIWLESAPGEGTTVHFTLFNPAA
ncbi:MAG: response regulator [Alphaproteobacteria bacterium]|nr:response regulator [Alphaproteobacteria bacterium]